MGALWVIGGRELTPAMQEMGYNGYCFQFNDGGGRNSNYEDAWWDKASNHIDLILPSR